jgi:hypothetical protein
MINVEKRFIASLALVFLLVTLSAHGVLAYYPLDKNVTIDFGANVLIEGFQCLNATDNNVYCFIKTQTKIYRFNSTWGDEKSCLAGEPSTGWFYMTNESYVYYSLGGICTRYNITNISAGGTCAAESINCNGGFHGSQTITAGISQNLVYVDDGVLNTANQYLYGSYYGGSFNEISTPYKDNNSTLFASVSSALNEHQNFSYYLNGVYVKNIANPAELFNIAGGSVYVSMVATGNTIWAYIVDANTTTLEGSETDKLYKANFNSPLLYSASVLEAFYPLNTTINPSDINNFPLTAKLFTASNGTLLFFYDDVYVNELTINESTKNNQIFSVSTPATYGGHSWYAIFFDSDAGIQWTLPHTYFTLEVGVPSNISWLDYLGLNFASLVFGITDIPTARNLMSIFFSVLFSMITLLIAAVWGKIKGAILGQIFLISFIAWLVIFAVIGWLNGFVLILLMVLAGMMLWRMVAG